MIEERTPIFEELEKVFEERTNAYNAMKKNIASMWYCGHSKGSYSLSHIIFFLSPGELFTSTATDGLDNL